RMRTSTARPNAGVVTCTSYWRSSSRCDDTTWMPALLTNDTSVDARAVGANRPASTTTRAPTPTPQRGRTPERLRAGGHRLTDDDGDLAVRALLVLRVALVHTRDLRPQRGTLVAGRGASSHLASAVADGDLDIGVGDDVLVPDGIVAGAALRRDEDDAILVEDRRGQHGGAPLARLASDGVQLHGRHAHHRARVATAADDAHGAVPVLEHPAPDVDQRLSWIHAVILLRVPTATTPLPVRRRRGCAA